MLKIALLVLLIGCASNVDPGLLTKTIRKNEAARIYAACMQQRARNRADLRRHCKKLYVLYWANRAWEDCVNDGTKACGERPRYEDMP